MATSPYQNAWDILGRMGVKNINTPANPYASAWAVLNSIPKAPLAGTPDINAYNPNADWTHILRDLPSTSKGDSLPLWKKMLGSTMGLSSMVTNSIYDIGEGINHGDFWKTAGAIPKNFLYNPIKATANEWLHGEKGFGWNDIPGLGTLNLLNEQNHHGSDLLKQWGVDNPNVQRWGGLGLDMAFDPLTYLTGGSSAAMKSAGVAAARTAARDLGVAAERTRGTIPFTFGKVSMPWKTTNVDDVAAQVGEHAVNRELSKPIWQDMGMPQTTQDLIRNNASEKVIGAADAARGNEQNALLSLGIPFVNKAIGIGKKPFWMQKAFNKAPAKIFGEGAAHVTHLLQSLGQNADDIKLGNKAMTPDEINTFIEKIYGVNRPEDMTVPMFNHLSQEIKKYNGMDWHGDYPEFKPQPPADPFAPTGGIPTPPAPMSTLADAKTLANDLIDNLEDPAKADDVLRYVAKFPDEDIAKLTPEEKANLIDDHVRSSVFSTYDITKRIAEKHGIPFDEDAYWTTHTGDQSHLNTQFSPEAVTKMVDKIRGNYGELDAITQAMKQDPTRFFYRPTLEKMMFQVFGNGFKDLSDEEFFKKVVQMMDDAPNVETAANKRLQVSELSKDAVKMSDNRIDDDIRAMLQAGKSEDEIISELVQKYPDEMPAVEHTGMDWMMDESKSTTDGLIRSRIRQVADNPPPPRQPPTTEAVPSEPWRGKPIQSEAYTNLLHSISPYKGGEFHNPSRFGGYAPRSLGSKGKEEGMPKHFVNTAAGLARDADSEYFGRLQQFHAEKDKIDAFVRKHGVTKDDYRAVIFQIEKKYPQGYTPNPARQDIVNQLVDMLQPIIKRLGEQGIKAGSLDKLIPNYFPHYIPYRKEYAGILNDFSGQSERNRFNLKRHSFETLADEENAVAALKNDMQKAHDAGDTAGAESIDKQIRHIENMFETNAVEAVFAHGKESIKAAANRVRNDKLRDMGLILPKDAENMPHYQVVHYKELSVSDAIALGLKPGDMIHPEVYEGIKKIDQLFKDPAAQKLMDNLTSITNIWKSMVTIAKPIHFWNNFVGNVFNNFLAGVRIQDYSAAAKLLRDLRKGNLGEKGTKLMQEAIDQGVFGQGFTAEFKRYFEELRGSGKLTEGDTKIQKAEHAMRRILEKTWWSKGGVSVENMTRMANFLHGKAMTGSATKAAAQVRKYLFSYHEMTGMDKYTRMLVPFWMWTKNNVPLQFEQFFKNTRIYADLERVKHEWDKQTGSDLPIWAEDKYWKIPGTNQAIPLSLPMQDLDYAGTGIADTFRKGLSNLHPLPKVVDEIAQNKSLYTGKPINWDLPPSGSLSTQDSLNYALSQSGLPATVIRALTSSSSHDFWREAAGATFGKPFEFKKPNQTP